MPTQRIHQASFVRGELDPKIVSRVDVVAYEQGLKKARNVLTLNQGGIERRPGTVYRATAPGNGRIEPFIFSDDQEYIILFTNTVITIYSSNGTLLQTITSTGIATAELMELTVTQQADTMIITHKSFSPRILQRTGATTFSLSVFQFDVSVNGEKTYQPYFKFASDSITLDIDQTAKGTTGVTLTTSADYWTSAYVNTRIRYHGAEIFITGYTSATVATGTLLDDVEIELDADPLRTKQGSGVVEVTMAQHGFSTNASITISGAQDIFDSSGDGLATANLNGTFTITVVDDNRFTYTAGSSDTAEESVDGGGASVKIVGHPPTRNWDEQLYSEPNGFPRACCFHEQRLYFGGSATAPDYLTASKVGLFFNFDVGKGLDDESLQMQIASDQINEIRHLVSGRVLEIFTSGAEFFLRPQTGKNITPTDSMIVRQTSFGVQQSGMPRPFDGGTLYIQKNGKNIRDYVFASTTELFDSNNTSLESSHLIQSPTDTATATSLPDRTEQLYFLVCGDGTMCIYNSQKEQKIFGWTQWNTDGKYKSIACLSSTIFSLIERTIDGSTAYYLEQFATTQFDIPTDMSFTKTISGSYQPHGTVKNKGAVSAGVSQFIIDGATASPNQGDTFQFAGTGTTHTITSVTATGGSNEYIISVSPVTASVSDNTNLVFLTSRVFTGITQIGKTVHATSGSTEDGDFFYYGSAVVTAAGTATFPSPAAACDIGIDYDITVETLPQDVRLGDGVLTGKPRKIGKAILELSTTYNVTINSNQVLIGSNPNDDTTGLQSLTGKKEVHTLGYELDPTLTVSQTAPLPMRVLGITSEVYY
tara:strand:+ start:2602 stop:5061 length:2460 start_codon:yes stop_codon:yes gene_type:complete